MKNFLFESIWLLSPLEQKARWFQFHPKKNLVVGRNHTGKSTLIKSLFRTLGARPTGELAKWDERAISVIGIRVQERRYRVVHQSGNRAIFDHDGALIAVADNHQDWSAAFAGITGFNLVLTDKNGATVPADARCFFLPFYINQDGSWQSKWDTFTGMQQYKAPIGAVLDYFAGIKPPEYYSIHSKRAQVKSRLDELQREARLLERARERIAKSVPLTAVKMDASNFEEEITRLTTEVTELNKKQERIRDTTVREQEIVESIGLQIDLAHEALATYDNDAKYLRTESREPLSCPTCGAEHLESFLDHLNYAEDARVLRELISRLRKDEAIAREKHQRSKLNLQELQANYRRVADVLDTRRGDLRFGDVVSSMGAESAFRSFEEEEKILKEEIGLCRAEIGEMDEALANLTSRERSKQILATFRQAYASALTSLNMPALDTSKAKLTSRPGVSGSGGPRSVLAYYGALWRTCLGQHGSFAAPLVIDSPNQQGQDDINLPKVLQYLANDLPQDSQVIVGTEMDTQHEFDNRIVLDEPYRLLTTQEFKSIHEEMEPLITAMHSALDAREAM